MPTRSWGVVLLMACLAVGVGASDQPVRIYIAPDDHTGYMWSGDEETYREAILEMLDYYLDLADKTRNEEPDHQSRWNVDGNFWIWVFERNRSAEQFSRLAERIRDGHIGVPLSALVSCYGGMPTEAVLRGMYYGGSLERRLKVRFPIAIAMENQPAATTRSAATQKRSIPAARSTSSRAARPFARRTRTA